MKIKYLIISVLVSICFISVKSQSVVFPMAPDSSIIRIEELYKGLGKIFSNTYDGSKIINDYKTGILLTVDEIIKCEKILEKQYDNKPTYYKNLQTTIKSIKKHYYRQYIGFIDTKGDTCVFLILLNFKNYKKAMHYFPDWKQNASIGVGGFYGFNQIVFKINLTESIIDT